MREMIDLKSEFMSIFREEPLIRCSSETGVVDQDIEAAVVL